MECCCAVTLEIPGISSVSLEIPTVESLTLEIPLGAGYSVPYEGEYVVTPLPWEQTVLGTTGKMMLDDVTVLEIPYYRTSNPYGGDTIFIGMEAENG